MSATTKSSGELTPPGLASGPGSLIVNGVAVPVSPRADRVTAAEDPFVTPPRGIEGGFPADARRTDTAAATEREDKITPNATGFTPRPDRLAEPLSAANAQALLPPQACVFVAK